METRVLNPMPRSAQNAKQEVIKCVELLFNGIAHGDPAAATKQREEFCSQINIPSGGNVGVKYIHASTQRTLKDMCFIPRTPPAPGPCRWSHAEHWDFSADAVV